MEERGVEVIRGDVTDPAAVARTVAGCGVVFHLARARAHGGLPIRVVDAVNIGGAGIVAGAPLARGAARLVLGSSLAVYGRGRACSR